MEKILASVRHERETHFEYKEIYTIKNDEYWKKYFKLVRNLDGESVETINRVLDRINRIMTCEDEEMDLFTEREKECIRTLNCEYYANLYRLSEDIYSYKNYFIPQFYFDPIVFYYKYGLNEFKSLEKIRSGDIIDGGAYIGDSSVVLARETLGKVYAFEALSKNSEYIEKTIELNSLKNVEIVKAALGEQTGYSKLEENEIANWSTMIPYKSRKYERGKHIPISSIDDFVKKHSLKISLIKLHIEGMEYAAIRGAVETLKEQRPALMVHIHHTPTDFFEIKPYIEELQLGYSFKIWKPVDGRVYTGTLLLAEVV